MPIRHRPRWPTLPVRHEIFSNPPPNGWWFWIDPDGPSLGRYHEAVSNAKIRSEDGDEVVLVEAKCGCAFALDRLIDIAAPDDPLLQQGSNGYWPQCGICIDSRKTRPNWGAEILENARFKALYGRESYWTTINDTRPYEKPKFR